VRARVCAVCLHATRTAVALKSPKTFDFFTTEYFTAALATLMLSMGITLTPADFVRATVHDYDV